MHTESEYKYLVAKLKSKGLYVEKKLFVAVLDVMSRCDQLDFTKAHAIKISSHKYNITQKSIKDVLKNIEYITQQEAKKKYNTKGYYESKKLDEIMARDK